MRDALGWYDRLDVQTAVADAEAHEASVKHDLDEKRKALALAESDVKRLRPLAWASLYLPAYVVFASVRRSPTEYREAKSALAAAATQVSKLEADWGRAVSTVHAQREEADRHRLFDRPASEARLHEVELAIAEATPKYEALKSRASALDTKLARVTSELDQTARELATLGRKLDLAREYKANLDHAADARARYEIHQSAESHLGTGNPGRYISENRGNHERLERTVKKLEDRVRDIVRQEETSASVRKLVVDGSNLCHAGSQRIGLFALRALLPHLLEEWEVTVIFDQNITNVLRIDEPRLRAQLPGATVHIAGGDTKADQLILQLAAEAGSYALSNDKFSDYPEMDAIAGAKRIHIELVDDRAIIQDLDIDIPYSRTR